MDSPLAQTHVFIETVKNLTVESELDTDNEVEEPKIFNIDIKKCRGNNVQIIRLQNWESFVFTSSQSRVDVILRLCSCRDCHYSHLEGLESTGRQHIPCRHRSRCKAMRQTWRGAWGPAVSFRGQGEHR